jgi:hypothetical protein
MDEEHAVERLTQTMDATRASIGGTLEKIRGRVQEAADWRHYVDQYPAASLSLALGVGALGGRWLGSVVGPAILGSAPRPSPGAHGAASAVAGAAWESAPAEAAFRASRPWSGVPARAGSRLETMSTRVIDEMADAVELVVVPALMTRFRRLLGIQDAAVAAGRRDRAA